MLSPVLHNELVDVVHNRILALRNIETLINNNDFYNYYDCKNQEHVKEVRRLINDFDDKGLRHWLKEKKLEQLGTLGVRELRSMASQLGIPYYNDLNKNVLLSEIMRVKSNGEGRSNSIGDSIARGNETVDSEIGSEGKQISVHFGTDRRPGNGCCGSPHVAHGS